MGQVCNNCNNQSKSELKIRDSQKEQPDIMSTSVTINEDIGQPIYANYSNNSNICQSVQLDNFIFVKVVGRGSFGKVMLVSLGKDDNLKYYAMKILKKNMITKKNQKMHLQYERQILEIVKHPFVVELHFAFQSPSKLYLITDFMIGGELFFHLRKCFKFSEERARLYAAELILAIEYLHSKHIIYRDLKPENILLDHNGHIKITDFGLSKLGTKEGESTFTLCGTPEYLAPEILLSQGYDQSVDWYSFGAVMYEMLSGAPPFYSKDRNLMFKNRIEKQMEIKSWFSTQAISLLKGLLNQDAYQPKKRLGFKSSQEIKEHDFFSSVNWDDVIQMKIVMPFKPKIEGNLDLGNFDKQFTQEIVQDTPMNVNSKNEKFENFTYTKDI